MEPADRMDLAGRVALVTGAGQGIGRACAQALAARGAHVALLGTTAAPLERSAAELRERGARALAQRCDVTSADDVAGALDAALTAFGRVDVLVNNAGIGGAGDTAAMPAADFARVVDVSLRGSWLCSRAVAERMAAAGEGGAIVNLTSILALAPMPTRAAYASAKAGLVAYTQAAACEWARHGVRVNAVAPGYVLTEGMRDGVASGMVDHDAVVAAIPQRRMGTAAEIAQAVAFLASDAAAYVTGHTLVVDGGYTARSAIEAHPTS